MTAPANGTGSSEHIGQLEVEGSQAEPGAAAAPSGNAQNMSKAIESSVFLFFIIHTINYVAGSNGADPKVSMCI